MHDGLLEPAPIGYASPTRPSPPAPIVALTAAAAAVALWMLGRTGLSTPPIHSWPRFADWLADRSTAEAAIATVRAAVALAASVVCALAALSAVAQWRALTRLQRALARVTPRSLRPLIGLALGAGVATAATSVFVPRHGPVEVGAVALIAAVAEGSATMVRIDPTTTSPTTLPVTTRPSPSPTGFTIPTSTSPSTTASSPTTSPSTTSALSTTSATVTAGPTSTNAVTRTTAPSQPSTSTTPSAPEPSASPTTRAATRTGEVDATWTVRRGEHLWFIAGETLADAWGRAPTTAEIVPYWQRLIAANRDRLVDRDNPDYILSGQEFVLPPPPPATRR